MTIADSPAELLRDIAAGNLDAFEIFHRQFHNLVLAIALRILNDRHDAEDVAQEVFSMVWLKAGRYDEERGKPQSWLISMTRNRAIDRLRSKQRRGQLQDELESAGPSLEEQSFEEVLNSVKRDEESAVVRGAVKRLSAVQREVIELTYFHGLSQSEAAEELGAPLGTVKARARRGLMRLRSIVSQAI